MTLVNEESVVGISVDVDISDDISPVVDVTVVLSNVVVAVMGEAVDVVGNGTNSNRSLA